MSTTVQCAANEDVGARMSVEIAALEGYTQAPRVYLRIRDGFKERGLVNPTRADFLAAVEIECDAIVIDRAELPLIEPLPSQDSSDSVFVDGVVYDLDSPEPGWHRAEALRRLALAEYLAAHPPVDAVSAKALSDRLTEAFDVENIDLPIAKIDGVARRLLATGRVSVTP